MMKLWVGALYKSLGQVRSSDHSPLGAHPQKMWRLATTLGKSAQAV